MIKTITVIAALAAAPASASSLFDFDGLANDSVVNSATENGITATISAVENLSDGSSQTGSVRIFDTLLADNLPNDPDLVSTTIDGGDLKTDDYGNALIIQESDSQLSPDDNRFGGSITFNFDQKVDLLSFVLLDDADLTVSSPGKTSFMASVTTNGDFLETAGNPLFAGITELTFSFAESGAIDNIFVAPAAVPLPAALPLLAGALAGMGVFGRRRNQKAA